VNCVTQINSCILRWSVSEAFQMKKRFSCQQFNKYEITISRRPIVWLWNTQKPLLLHWFPMRRSITLAPPAMFQCLLGKMLTTSSLQDPLMYVYLKTFPSRTGRPSTVVSEHHISVTRALSSSDTGVDTLIQSYLSSAGDVVVY